MRMAFGVRCTRWRANSSNADIINGEKGGEPAPPPRRRGRSPPPSHCAAWGQLRPGAAWCPLTLDSAPPLCRHHRRWMGRSQGRGCRSPARLYEPWRKLRESEVKARKQKSLRAGERGSGQLCSPLRLYTYGQGGGESTRGSAAAMPRLPRWIRLEPP